MSSQHRLGTDLVSNPVDARSATHLTVRLVRFDDVREVPAPDPGATGESLWSAVVADAGAAGGAPGDPTASVWMAIAAFANEPAARADFDNGASSIPWASEAADVWTALLQPFSHRGVVNWMGQREPGSSFATGDAPAGGESFAVVTTAGWDFGPALDLNRVADFANSSRLVHASIVGADGLRVKHAFAVPGRLDIDLMTFTIWRDDAAMRAFAYRPGVHQQQMDRLKRLNTADRTSFTRLRIVDCSGTWLGGDPRSDRRGQRA